MLSKYKYSESEVKELLKSMVVLVDSREQVNTHITDKFDKQKIKHKKYKLDQGDYSFYLPANPGLNIDRDIYFDKCICLERKAHLDELAGNFSADRARIEKEFATCKAKLTLMIEQNTYKDVCEGNYRSGYNKASFLGTLHSFKERYGVDFIFLDRDYTATYIYSTFYYYLREMLK